MQHAEGAVRMEQGVNGDVDAFIINRWDKPFIFSKEKAYRNVEPIYTQEMLNEVSAILSKWSRPQLKNRERLNALLQSKKSKNSEGYRYKAVIAHFLLEQGIMCGIGCGDGSLCVWDPK